MVFLIDGATLNGISSTLFSGKAAVPQIVPSNEIGWFEFLYTATSNPMDGSIYAAGISTRRVNTTVSQCGYWNYTVEGWGYGGGLGTPIVVKLDSELELPTARG